MFTQDGEEEEFKDLAEENDDEDEEEHFVDADKVEEGTSVEAKEVKPTASWVHHQNLEGLSDTFCLCITDVDICPVTKWFYSEK